MNVERLCEWAIGLGLATGHADTEGELLIEVGHQVKELHGRVERLTAELDRKKEWMKDASHKQHCMMLDPYDERDRGCTCGDELPICECAVVWPGEGHHPECPVRREIEHLRHSCDVYEKAETENAPEVERLTAERDDYKERWEQTGCTRHYAMEAAIKVTEARSATIERLTAELEASETELRICRESQKEAIADGERLTAERDRLRKALKRIAAEDYRGPRPSSAIIAEAALREEGGHE